MPGFVILPRKCWASWAHHRTGRAPRSQRKGSVRRSVLYQKVRPAYHDVCGQEKRVPSGVDQRQLGPLMTAARTAQPVECHLLCTNTCFP